MLFSASDYYTLSKLTLHDSFPSFSGRSGNSKRVSSYVSVKNIVDSNIDGSEKRLLYSCVERAHHESLRVAITLGIPRKYWPNITHSRLRVLEYPPGTDNLPHADANMFTLTLYRNFQDTMFYPNDSRKTWPEHIQNEFRTGLVFGELMQLVMANKTVYPPTLHGVSKDMFERSQYSVVYFAQPDGEAVLPGGITVADYVAERQRNKGLI